MVFTFGLTYLTYASSFLVEHRAATTLLKRTRFWDVLFSSAHVFPGTLTSASRILRQICFGRPSFLSPGDSSRGLALWHWTQVFEACGRSIAISFPGLLFKSGLVSFSPTVICCYSLEMNSPDVEDVPGHLLMKVWSLWVLVLVTYRNVTLRSGWWSSTVTPSIDQALHQFLTLLLIWTLLSNLTFYLIARGFHRTFATGAACQQRTLTPPDTWSCPTLGLASVLMLRPISPELVLSPHFWVSNIPRYFRFCSEPYSKTDFTLVWKIRILLCSDSAVDLHIASRKVVKVCRALFIRLLMSSSVPPSLLTILPR